MLKYIFDRKFNMVDAIAYGFFLASWREASWVYFLIGVGFLAISIFGERKVH